MTKQERRSIYNQRTTQRIHDNGYEYPVASYKEAVLKIQPEAYCTRCDDDEPRFHLVFCGAMVHSKDRAVDAWKAAYLHLTL